MQLLMTMKERVAWIVGDEVHLHGAVRRDIDDIFYQARSTLFANTHQLEAVTMEMERMRLRAAIDEDETVPLVFL